MGAINTFTVSSEIQTSCESSVDAWSKEARWNSLLPSNSLLQTTQRCSLYNSAVCCSSWTAKKKQRKGCKDQQQETKEKKLTTNIYINPRVPTVSLTNACVMMTFYL